MATQPFISTSQRGEPWFCVGPASSFPDITKSGEIILSDVLSRIDSQAALQQLRPCKVYLAPARGDPNAKAEQLSDDPQDQLDASLRKGDQVLVFRYKGTFHAIDNKCPHSSYPLSNGICSDIEDFGIALSACITCPKHGWSFDLFSGRSDRGAYRLKLWEVQLRDSSAAREHDDIDAKEVWVRRKARMG